MSANARSRKRDRKPSNRFSQQQQFSIGDTGVMEELHQEIQDMQQDIVKLSCHKDSGENKIELLSAIVVKEHKMITNLYENVIDLRKQFMQNEFVILNLMENGTQNLRQAVIYMLNAIGITEELDFEAIYRRGPARSDPDAKPRPVIVRLHRRDVVERILRIKRPAPNRTPGTSSPRIVPNLPEPLRQRRAKLGAIANRYYETNQGSKIKVKENHVLVNGEKKLDQVKQVTPSDILFMDQKTRATIQSYDFTTTAIKSSKSSHFQMYIRRVNDIHECNMAHHAIATIPDVANKTHLISAYTLQNGEFGWQDDQDHGLGNFLYRAMVERELTNCICFVTREYGGEHIGKERFELIIKLLDEVIINAEARPNKFGDKQFTISPPA
jgi:RNA-binding protein YhbY